MNSLKKEMNPNQTVLVLGGFGFIGRHVVEQLERFGAQVLIGTRGERSPRRPGTRHLLVHKLTSPDQWDELLDGVDIVVNTVGILRERIAETYEHVHHFSVAALANACADKSIRLVHISALGLDNPVESRFLISKRRGEQAVMRYDLDWYLVRPSLIDGDGGYGAKWFRRVARWPVYFASVNATGYLTPIDVEDVGEAIAKIALKTDCPDDVDSRIYELGGHDTHTVFEYLSVLGGGKPRMTIRIPVWIARLASHLMDLLHLTPYSFGHYELLKFNNCPNVNRLPELLGRPARLVGRSARKTAPAYGRIESIVEAKL